MSSEEILDAAVVGAGWAGLGVSAALIDRGLRHRLFERGRIADSWRTKRWDSFVMNTTNRWTVMPGDRYEGADPDGVMTCDAFVAMLDDYARRRRLPVEEQTPVTSLTADGELFRLAIPGGTVVTRNVVVANGNLNQAVRPGWADGIPAAVVQLDAATYRSPGALPEGAVLVVGSGQSGAQIAQDLMRAGRRTYLATSQLGRIPRRYRGADIVDWFVDSGLFDVPRREFALPDGSVAPRALLGTPHTISLQSLSVEGVELVGRFNGCDGERLLFADDVAENIRFADEASTRIKQQVDAYILRAGLDAPPAEDDPGETVAPRLPASPVVALDLKRSGIATIVWCAGFVGDYSWIKIPGVLDARGQPLHEDSVAPVPGVLFAGIDYATTRRSGTILAVAEEAARLVGHIANRI